MVCAALQTLAEVQVTLERSSDHGHTKCTVRVCLFRQCQPDSHCLHDMLIRMTTRQDLHSRLLELSREISRCWQVSERWAAAVDVEGDQNASEVSGKALLVGQAQVVAQLVRGEGAGQAMKQEEVATWKTADKLRTVAPVD